MLGKTIGAFESDIPRPSSNASRSWMNGTVTIAGWGQPHDALRMVAPDAMHIDYASTAGIEQAFAVIAQQAREAHTVIGWSQGGQLAVRAIAQGLIAPERLVLIAAPFQFVENDSLKLGMNRDAFKQFRDSFQTNSRRALRKFSALVSYGDARRDEVAALLGEPNPDCDWLPWLDELSHFSAQSLDFSGFPPTMLLHGLRDVVVHPDQSRAYAERIPDAALELWPQAAHAPHLHDLERFKHWLSGQAA
jgi:pimeloyl-ACP methyl ester carboxylesterase